MVLLGLAVRKGSTPLDDWFLSYNHSPIQLLKYLMFPRLTAVVLVVAVAVAVSQRRWHLAAAVVLAPVLGVVLANALKRLFERPMDGVFAYPSGHATFTVTLLGMAVLVAGGARWAVLLAIAWSLLGMVGIGASFHYFTDTVGAALLGSAIVCVAALISGRELDQT